MAQLWLRNSFNKSCVRQTSFHSAFIFRRPLMQNCRTPRHCLICSNTGTMIALRRAYSSRPLFVHSLQASFSSMLKFFGGRPMGAAGISFAIAICDRLFADSTVVRAVVVRRPVRCGCRRKIKIRTALPRNSAAGMRTPVRLLLSTGYLTAARKYNCREAVDEKHGLHHNRQSQPNSHQFPHMH